MVTVDEAGGALQSPEPSSFHGATALNTLYKIRDTDLHGSYVFFCWSDYEKCVLLNVSRTHAHRLLGALSKHRELDLMAERHAGVCYSSSERNSRVLEQITR